MEYSVSGKIISFSDTLGTIKAIEDFKQKSFMAIVASSYSTTGVCIAKLEDMLDVIEISYAKAHPQKSFEENAKEILQFIEENMTYPEIFQMYDKILVSLQYPGKTDDEIANTIMGNVLRAEEVKKRFLKAKS